MKRYKKKELLDSVSALEKANDEILRSFALDVAIKEENLASCQELAMAVGNVLESFEEKCETIVEILENYCENLYQMSLVLKVPDKRRKLAKKIQKQLYAIRNGIKYDLPEDRIEVLFLPYKASMWDSLESIWKAASEDESCDAYVVPIPYFDKNADGSLGRMYDEENQYPEYVRVTSWQEYSISERKPDITYIHNPYDECNYVTSVHPSYYAAELKKHTDMLVYVPYFVAIRDIVGRHFCRVPGVFLSDRVIVQSEAVRDIYIKELHECEKEYNCSGAFGDIKAKILALGSPKYDKVVSIDKDEYKIPEAWKSFRSRENGSKKKVILYNTTIDGLLKHNERMLRKIKDVLAQFQKEKDTVLLWRPHPLLQATLESIRPRLAREYRELVEKYKQEGYGIFDDSADMYSAIAFSDAYFGDMSSVAELYRRTGKPLLIESVFYGGEVGLAFEALARVDEDTAYASCAMFNGLFRVNLGTGDCTYVSMFPGMEEDKSRMHSGALYADGKVYFFPMGAECVSAYRISDGVFETFPEETKVLRDWRLEYQAKRKAPYTASALEEDGYGTAFLFELKPYRYFIKFKGKRVNRNPLMWNLCEYFRINTIDGSVENCLFRFAVGKDKFILDHQVYLKRIKKEQWVDRENIFYQLDSFIQDIAQEKHSGDTVQDRLDGGIGNRIHKSMLGALLH